MAAFLERKERKVIPRWRPFRVAAALGELSLPHKEAPPASFAQEYLSRKVAEWQSAKTVWHATDLMGAALVLGKPEQALEAAKFVLIESTAASSAAKEIARDMLREDETPAMDPRLFVNSDPERLPKRIHALRLITRAEPRNAIAWVDLALAHTVAGEIEKAGRAMEIAVKLHPANRFILRCATRFHVHRGDPRYAHNLVAQAESTPHDPWLMAAEIAVGSAARRKSKFAKRSNRFLEHWQYSPIHTSELASALATLEFENGKHRSAVKLFRSALKEPTENSVAQAEWASHYVNGLEVDVGRFNIPHLYEANAWRSFIIGDWDNALMNSMEWLDDQPFSTRPALVAEYLASTIFEDYRRGEKILTRALTANPSDPVLLNDLAFTCASMDRVDRAERALARVRLDTVAESGQVALLATHGLVMFRKGELGQGRTLYLDAIQKAVRHGLKKHGAVAAIYLAREELHAKTDHAREAFLRAIAQSKGILDPDFLVLLSRLKKQYDESPGR